MADEAQRAEATATRRFRRRDHLLDLRRRGVERVYLWFTDFADPTALRTLGRRVLGSHD